MPYSYLGGHIRCLNIGSWIEKGTKYFNAGHQGTSRVSESGDNVIYVDSLDNILDKKPVTFIKMDIEGSELPSLKGSSKIISAKHPKLAICIYHSDSDMLEIPEYILKNYPFYSLFIRHYSHYLAETVLYAVPAKEQEK